MQTLKRWLCVGLVLTLFSAMALGSSSDSESENKGETSSITGKVDSVSATAEENSSNSDSENAEKSSEPKYEVGEGIITTWTNSIGSTWIRVAIPVTNTGDVNLYLSSGSIDIENSSGSLEDTLKLVSAYPQILRPGETAYYFDETSYDGQETTDLKAIPHVDVKKAKVDCIRYSVSDIQIKDTDYFGAKVSGRVENTTDTEDSMIYIVANLFDANGVLIGQQFTILSESLAPGEKIGFETSSLSDNISADQVASYEIFAYPNQYQF